ncbi:dolichyl-phosphate-mannose--protein mannosyltransferase [Timonella sp. A28]|uniref:dolichyl-phosphate-mannose--protein mannosyltransferase n=1 Tax=Timonella sp. A28 TaxID=3442640 RepID=UPI003EC0224B
MSDSSFPDNSVTIPAVPSEKDAHEPSTYDRLLGSLFSARQLAVDATRRARMWGWLAPSLVALFAGVLRFIRLGQPPTLVFDETYYVKGAYTLLRNGYENDWPDDPNEAWNSGVLDGYLPNADYVVHPPLGKWMIAFGMWIGDPSNAFFWRFSTALVSVIAVFLIVRVVRSMTGSTLAGVAAGGLFAIDGVAIVHARTGLLDSFLMFFVVVAFVLLVKDRTWRRKRLARRVAARIDHGLPVSDWGPRLGWSWWRFSAALTLGLACGVKWSGLYFLAVFCVMAVLWDAGARKAVGVKHWMLGAFWRDAVPSALIMLPTAFMGYLLAWTSWFVNDNSYGRHWHVDHPGSYWEWIPTWMTNISEVLRSLWNYHSSMMNFHTGLSAEHTYMANPWGWLIQLRPTSFYWEKSVSGENGCSFDECAVAVTSLGNPLLWWLATAAFAYLLFRLVTRADWIAGGIVAGVVAGWVPWLFFPDRTIFTFYTIAFAPFMYMALAYVGYLLWLRAEQHPEHKSTVKILLIGFTILILIVSLFFYPIWTAMQVPYDFWRLHMWLPSWV